MKKGIKCKNVIKRYKRLLVLMMLLKKTEEEHYPNWPQIHDNPYRILIIGGSVSGKLNSLLNAINEEPDIDKVYLYTQHPYKAKYQLLIKKIESTSLKHINDSKAFIEYTQII